MSRSAETVADRPDLAARLCGTAEEIGRSAALGVGSPAKVRWRCDRGHEFVKAVRAVACKPDACPYCNNREVLAGFNDLATIRPDLVSEWHPEKNVALSPADVMPGTPTKVWWLGSCGHSWQAEVRSRVKGYGCGVCAGKHVVDSTSLGRAVPDIASWWHPQNGLTLPDVGMIHRGSNAVARFVCPVGHEFSDHIHHFVNRKHKCLICAGDLVIDGLNSLADTHPDAAAQWHPDNTHSARQVSASSAGAARFRCGRGHEFTSTPRDMTRSDATGCPFCAGKRYARGISDFATLRPDLLAEWDDPSEPSDYLKSDPRKVWWKCVAGHRYRAAVGERTRSRGTGCSVCTNKHPTVGVDDLATTHPEWATQWHPDNDPLRPEDVKATSGRSARWRIQDCGHEWTQAIRYRRGTECPVCAGIVSLPGVNDVASLRPVVLTFLNGTPDDLAGVGPGSPKNFSWRCREGHPSWRQSVRNLVAMIDSDTEPCPYCAGRRAIPGQTDVATTRPDLVAEINLDVHPADLLVGLGHGNGTRVSWRCAKDHVWSARVVDRIHHETGCPDCAAASWRSRGEDEVADFVASLGFEVSRSMRIDTPDGTGERFNYDIRLPAQKVLIEFNGLYWHSDALPGRGADYHARKQACAEAAGYRLISVWEDDWRDRRAVVEATLRHKLGISTSAPVAARRTRVVGVDRSTAAAFMEANHLQGTGPGSIRLGLVDTDGSPVAVLIARYEGDGVNIVRYATSTIVPGGFGKLLKALEARVRAERPEVRAVKTFSDNMISDGDLYARLGFEHQGDVRPDYTYLRHNSRHHKFGYRIARFRSDPSLKFEEGLTEAELAALNGLHRIWDAGKKRWVKQIGH